MATSKTLAPTNVTISIPAMTDAPNAAVISNCLDKEADAINALNSQIAEAYGNIATNIDYQKTGHVVTVYINGATISNASSWTELATLPEAIQGLRYSAHYTSMNGIDIQISGEKIKYRGTGSDIWGAFTYVIR